LQTLRKDTPGSLRDLHDWDDKANPELRGIVSRACDGCCSR
jgi:hypothetical protein